MMVVKKEELITGQSYRHNCAGTNNNEQGITSPSHEMEGVPNSSAAVCSGGSVAKTLPNNDTMVASSKQQTVRSLFSQESISSEVARANKDCTAANHLSGAVIERRKKSVQFASTKKVRQFDINACTNFPEEEFDIDFQCISNLRSRRASRKKETTKTEKTSTLSISNLLGLSAEDMNEPRSVFVDERERMTSSNCGIKKEPIKVALMHSFAHTQILQKAMQYIHRDRDILLESLLKWCGFFHGASKGGPLSSFFTVVSPKWGTRMLLEKYHGCHYLDLLQFHTKPQDNSKSIAVTMRINEDETDTGAQDADFQAELTKYGLEDDCPLPVDRRSHDLLWRYCLAVSGASCHAASLLSSESADVALHWGGGRHHAHDNKAGGFCYVNDIVLAISQLLHRPDSRPAVPIRRVLYLDLDIHHPDGVQSAFYSTDEVLTASFHRHAAGFFPASSGSISEKGQSGTKGLGYNLNVPLPVGTSDIAFLYMFHKLLFGLVGVYDPDAIVLCVGADGLKDDPLVSGGTAGFDLTSFGDDNCDDDMSHFSRSEGSCEGWSLSPECLAECVRIAAAVCSGHDEKGVYSLFSSSSKDNFSVMKDSDGSLVESSRIESCPIDKEHLPETCASNMVWSDEMRSNNDSSYGFHQPSNAIRLERRRRKLLVLGGGGYSPSQSSRTWLLCTAAACEGARPNLFWKDLPKDVPNHEYLLRYGPSFELVSREKLDEFSDFYSSVGQDQLNAIKANLLPTDQEMLQRGIKAIDLSCLYIERQRKKDSQATNFSYQTGMRGDEEMLAEHMIPKKSYRNQTVRRGRRKKTKRLANGS